MIASDAMSNSEIPASKRVLSEHELGEVSGGAIPLVILGTIYGAGIGAANAHASGGNVVAGAIGGAVTGVLTGTAGLIYGTSRLLSSVVFSVGAAVGGATAYHGAGGKKFTMINYL